MERMFDEHSFTDEIKSKKDAESCVMYLSHNESKFRKELASEGLSYEEIEAEVAKVWKNLLNACKKFGFSNYITEAKRKQFGVK